MQLLVCVLKPLADKLLNDIGGSYQEQVRERKADMPHPYKTHNYYQNVSECVQRQAGNCILDNGHRVSQTVPMVLSHEVREVSAM